MTDEMAEMKPTRFVCIGPVELTGGDAGIMLGLLDDNQRIVRRCPFTRSKATRKLMVGAMYEIPARFEAGDNPTSIQTSDARFRGLYPDESERVVWQTEARAMESDYESKREEAKLKDDEALLRVLRPLRERYMKTFSHTHARR